MPRADHATIDRLTDYFDGEPGALNAMGMGLESCQALEGGFVWLRYRFSWDR